MGENPLRFLRTVGQRLAQLHIAAETFSAHPCRMRPAGAYVQAMFERSLSRPLERDELQAVDDLRQNVEAGFSRVLGLEIPWIMCRGDVSRRNTLATGEGEIGFTDFDSAEYAPALFDLVMTRFQWFMGQGLLGLPEATEILLGYQSERPLRDSERSVFPEVWAAYYVDRLTFLRVKWGQTKRQRDVGGETLRLPECAVRTGQELLQAAGLFCGGHS
jgi:Ser/Thr protein kinase RdoA (MazF antagonist)